LDCVESQPSANFVCLKQSMPPDWDGTDEFARLRARGIEWEWEPAAIQALVSALVKFSGSRSDHAWASHALPAKFFEIDQWLPLCKMIGAEERHG
jgi:hypothetical protein